MPRPSCCRGSPGTHGTNAAAELAHWPVVFFTMSHDAARTFGSTPVRSVCLALPESVADEGGTTCPRTATHWTAPS
jgi:hypothetical protein